MLAAMAAATTPSSAPQPGVSETAPFLASLQDQHRPAQHSLLGASLTAAVPLLAAEFARQPWALVQANTEGLADLIAAKGDVLLYGSKQKGETAELFNRLARGIAAMSFWPGGVEIFGQRFVGQHPGLADPHGP